MTTAILQPVITEAGLAAIWRAGNDGVSARITHIALGDSGYLPAQTQTRLRTEKARYPISDGKRLANNQLHLTAVADGDRAFWVREVAFLLEDGTLLAVWSDPATPLAYKSPGVDLLLAYDLLLAALPADSVTVESSGAGLNLSLAGELAALAAAGVAESLRGVGRDEDIDQLQTQHTRVDKHVTNLRARISIAETQLARSVIRQDERAQQQADDYNALLNMAVVNANAIINLQCLFAQTNLGVK